LVGRRVTALSYDHFREAGYARARRKELGEVVSVEPFNPDDASEQTKRQPHVYSDGAWDLRTQGPVPRG
jgi:hypothetical protein